MHHTDAFYPPFRFDSSLGHRTRSGNVFSPFTLGPPVRATTDFNIAHRLQSCNDKAIADEDQGIESEDEYEVEPPEPPPSVQPISHSSLGPIQQPCAHLASSTTASESRQKRTRKQQHVKDVRARKRAEMRAQYSLEQHSLKSVTLKRRQGLEGLRAAVESEHFKVASSGWVGGRLPSDKSTYTLEEVTKAPYNLHHIQWDGRWVQLQLHIYLQHC